MAVFIIPVAVKKFRATLKENWLATGKDKCQVEKYMLDNRGTKRTTSTSTTSTGKAEFSDADIERIVSHCILCNKGEINISILKKKRQEFLDFMENRDLQENEYQITDENQAVLEKNGLQEGGIEANNNIIEATIRYMLLMGDIVIYHPAIKGFKVALNLEGKKKMLCDNETKKLLTKKVLLKIDKDMKQLNIPAPIEFRSDYEKFLAWMVILTKIKIEFYEKNFRSASFDRPLSIDAPKIENAEEVFDKFVSMGIIHAWNFSEDEEKAFLQITPQDKIDNDLPYSLSKWRDSSVINQK